MNELITLILIYPIIWLLSFLIHEYMHIKGQGLTSTGKIYINKTGMTASCNNIKNVDWFFYSGGVLSAMVLFTLCVLVTSDILRFCLWSTGWVQLCYGIFEGIKQSHVEDRYYVYGAVVLLTFIIWWW